MSQGTVSYFRKNDHDSSHGDGPASNNFQIKGNVNHLKAKDSKLSLAMQHMSNARPVIVR